jgi:6-phosphogluconate dehydrogenase
VSLALLDTDKAATTRLAGLLGPRAHAAADARELVANLSKPQAVFLMVPAGKPVDDALAELLPLLSPGAIIIDGGNSHYLDTVRRAGVCAKHRVEFCGTGVSGGAEGARRGPAVMAGGSEDAYRRVGPWLEAIAAKVGNEPCCARIGPDGAGHFVKMVHNGIEYAVMQLIAEAYAVMRDLLHLDRTTLHGIFSGWATEQGSYLLECTVDVLGAVDGGTGRPLVDLIEDTAEQKGTGRWATEAALLFGVPTPTLGEAVMARALSAGRKERRRLAEALGPLPGVFKGDNDALLAAIDPALQVATLVAYDQGFQLIAAGSVEHKWSIDRAAVARLWRGGCIVRSNFLAPIAAAYAADGARHTLFDHPPLREVLRSGEAAWRALVASAVASGVAVPAFGSALSWLDAWRTARLPTNMIAGQRDVFGQHGFTRLDRGGRHHGSWSH